MTLAIYRQRSATLDGHVLAAFLPVFAAAMLFFILLLEMAELFVNIVQYVQNDISLASILESMLLYLPQCVGWALPIAMLFSASYALGTMYTNNEVLVVYSSGISLVSFVAPLIFVSLIMSLGFFFFNDAVIIPATAMKREATKTMLKKGEPAGAADVTIIGEDRNLIWHMRYFDRKSYVMTGVVIVERDNDGSFISRLNAQSATWTGELWRFNGVRRFYWVHGTSMTDETRGTWEDPRYAEPPESFKGGGKPIEELQLSDAKDLIDFLRRAGLPHAAQRAEYLRRYAFSMTPFIVTLLSTAIVGMFRKNVLLMSLLYSLVAATLYYVVQMISMLLAKNQAISPAAGAFSPLILFLLVITGVMSLRRT